MVLYSIFWASIVYEDTKEAESGQLAGRSLPLPRMRIAFLFSNKIGSSACEIGLSWLHHMALMMPNNEFLLLTNKTKPLFLPTNVVVHNIPSYHPWFPWITAQQIKRVLRAWTPQGLVITSQEYPLTLSTPKLIIDTGSFHPNKQEILRKSQLLRQEQVRFIVLPSRETEALEQHWKATKTEQLPVIPPVASPFFKAKSTAEKEQHRNQYASGQTYFMLANAPHKADEFTETLKAFSIFKKRQQTGIKLLLPFDLLQQFPGYQHQLNTYKYREELIITGEIDTSTRAEFAASAYALIMTESAGLAEAFVMESLQSETPIILPRTAAAEAMAGPAALYFLSGSTQDLAEKLMLIYKDETLRNQLLAQGKQRPCYTEADLHRFAFSQLLKSLAN